MKYLLDTNVLSEARHPKGDVRVKSWLEQLSPTHTYVSAITFGEIAKGAARLPAGAKQQEFRRWLSRLHVEFKDRILAVDAEVTETWGEADALGRARGKPVQTPDGFIAATARVHGLHVATRNCRHMLDAGAAAFDPWTGETHEPIP